MKDDVTYVELVGEAVDVAAIVPLLRQTGASVEEDGGHWYVHHDAFPIDQDRLLAAARDLVDQVRGIHLAGHGRLPQVSAQGLLEPAPSGVRTLRLVVTATSNIQPRTSVRVQIGDGQHQSIWPDDAIEASVTVSSKNAALARAAVLLARQGESWGGLYKVLECLQEAGLDPVRHEWCSQATLSRFTQTANSHFSIGELARHAKSGIPPPAEPMSLSDATGLLRGFLLRAGQVKP